MVVGPGGAAKTGAVEVAGAEGVDFDPGLDDPAPIPAAGEKGRFNFNGGSPESAESNDIVTGLRSRPGNMFLAFGPSELRKGEGPLEGAEVCGAFLKTSL